jgi:hypothetical protein
MKMNPLTKSLSVGLTATMMTCAILAGCEGPPTDEPLAEVEQPLFLSAAKWPNGIVPVCWHATALERTDFTQRSREVRRRAINAWSTVAKVQFTGWSQCGSVTAGKVILYLGATDFGASSLGFKGTGVQHKVVLPTQNAGWGFGLIEHEFGHILGFGDETWRPDFKDDLTGTCREANRAGGTTLTTPPDRQSIMASGRCNNNSTLSVWDIYGVQRAYGVRVPAFKMLLTAWNAGRTDHATVGTLPTPGATQQAIEDAAYKYAYVEGWIYAPGVLNANMLPLKVYWNAARLDHATAANPTTAADLLAAGYREISVEGSVYEFPQPGTVPLKQWYSPTRLDHMVTATDAGARAALDSGYHFVRNEGYLFSSTPYNILTTYFEAVSASMES